MGMLLHRHFAESPEITTQEGHTAPSEAVKDKPVEQEKKPVEKAVKPVKRGRRSNQ